MENHFSAFREGIIGIDAKIPTPAGSLKKIIYADWTASGRNYLPIENRIQQEIMPLVANTHTETSATGMAMTFAYHSAQQIIKKHVNAHSDDHIITATSGMTRLVNKLQRIMRLRLPRQLVTLPPEDQRPVVFITHMEHHSNQTSWLETIATLEIIKPTDDGLIDLRHLSELLFKYRKRPLKIASVTACSNVTGIMTPYHQIAKMMHENGGYCFVDFASCAPYINMNMHPKEEGTHLDAIFFSPHKFLGGPGSAGVLIFNQKLYSSRVPDNAGGGTVDWTNPWGEHKYVEDIEAREDGGTPAFLQSIKTAMCIQLKEEMGVDNIRLREHQLLDILWAKLEAIPNLHILASQHRNRQPIISFYIENLHYHLGVKMLNDKFGIQCRGGCSCAGTYGHYLLDVDQKQSKEITDLIDKGDFSTKPGWIRVSLHPTMTEGEVWSIAEGVAELAKYHQKWAEDYHFDPSCNLIYSTKGNTEGLLKHRISLALVSKFVVKSPFLIPELRLKERDLVGEELSYS